MSKRYFGKGQENFLKTLNIFSLKLCDQYLACLHKISLFVEVFRYVAEMFDDKFCALKTKK